MAALRIVHRPSPNQSSRVHGQDEVRLVICHTPEGSYASATATILSRNSQVSYHQLLNEAGTEATQFVEWVRKAWHAKTYNSASDGVSAAGFARDFDVRSDQARAFARLVAIRLIARDLPPRWARDGGGKGFCRHGDIQSDRSDPMSVDKWIVFARMVRSEYRALSGTRERQPVTAARLEVLRAWILGRRAAGWSWRRVKSTANWREFRRGGGE